MADDADVGHASATFLDDEVRPALVAVADERLVRPVESAAVGLHTIAGVHEKDAVEILEVIVAFLADRDKRKRLSGDAQLAERLFLIVIVHAAVNLAAQDIRRVVRALA